MTKYKCTHPGIHIQVTICTKTKVRTGIFKVNIALLWTRTSLNPGERKLRKERKDPAYSHHYPIEGAVTQQINLPIPKNYHEQYKILVK